MLYYIGSSLQSIFGPARLLQSFTVLIALALYAGFILTEQLLPKWYRFLPSDRGREFTINAEAAKGKPTGAGSFFITVFVLLCFLLIPMQLYLRNLMIFLLEYLFFVYISIRNQYVFELYQLKIHELKLLSFVAIL